MDSIHNVSEWSFLFFPSLFRSDMGSFQKPTGDSLANSRLRQRRSSETRQLRIGVGTARTIKPERTRRSIIIQRDLIAGRV